MTVCFVQLAPRDVIWSAVLDEIKELLGAKRESARGPGGLPYSVYRCADCIGAKFLFAACQATLQGAALKASVLAERFSFLKLLRSTPRACLSSRQNLLDG